MYTVYAFELPFHDYKNPYTVIATGLTKRQAFREARNRISDTVIATWVQKGNDTPNPTESLLTIQNQTLVFSESRIPRWRWPAGWCFAIYEPHKLKSGKLVAKIKYKTDFGTASSHPVMSEYSQNLANALGIRYRRRARTGEPWESLLISTLC